MFYSVVMAHKRQLLISFSDKFWPTEVKNLHRYGLKIKEKSV
jgi:hypothetical protein